MQKIKIIFILLCFCSSNVFAQFFDEEDIEIAEDSEIINIVPTKKASILLPDSLTAYSKIFLGTPYRYGGTSVTGFDCSGFMQYIFKNFGLNLQRTATAQYLSHKQIEKAQLRKGDLVFFEGRQRKGKIGHVGMVVSDSIENDVFKFIHASVTNGVIISKSNEPYYSTRYKSACRVIEIENENNISLEMAQLDTVSLQKNEQLEIFYIVKKGDNLYQIAKKFGTTIAKIKKENCLKSDNLKIKQRLKIK
ncbi:MAG: C40 family peptidase [Prevotellaceae bacterium]|jgi:LysM repeat protein|nr:C40 family peptidase [Prevotellaceae bacterium]